METLSLPGWAAPTLAGTLTPPEGTEPRRTKKEEDWEMAILSLKSLPEQTPEGKAP